MNKKISIALSIATFLMIGCSDKPKEDTTKTQKTQTTATETTSEPQNIYGTTGVVKEASAKAQAPAGAQVQTNAPHVGKILETVDAAGYTYAKVDEDGVVYWIAAPQTSVKVGDKVSYIEQMVMKDFTSKALNKTFDYLMFASAMVPPKAEHDHASHAGKPHPTAAAPVAHDHASHAGKPHPTPNVKEMPAEKINVAKLKGGYSVEELYNSKDKLKGKSIKLKAKVVKVSKGIMGKDWIHLQDGTGVGATSDIIVTTKNSTVNVGDVVTTQAILNTDVDLGYGYFFSVILEKGIFTK